MKTVWLVSHYAMPPELEQRVKTLRYAQLLQKKGYNVKMITASTIHNTDINLIEGKEKFVEKTYDGIDYIHVKVSQYGGNGIKRILNLLQFSNRFYKIAKKLDKPDVIVADVNCVNYRGIYKYCKKNGVKFYCDIRDLWPLSIVEYLGMSNTNPIITYLYGQEKKLYKVADGVIFSMEGGKQYIIDKGWDKDIDLSKVHYINNGIDYDKAVTIDEETKFADVDLDDNKFKVVYTGSIRTANNVKAIVDVANIVKEKDKDIEFLIYGDGDDRPSLEKYCAENGINNVIFKGKVKKTSIPYLLSKCDLACMVGKKVAIWKYGGSLNKMFDYMAAGKPIISNIKIGYSLFEKYNCGYCIEDSAEIADKIVEISKMDKAEYNKLCENARNGAKNYDFARLTEQLIDIIEE